MTMIQFCWGARNLYKIRSEKIPFWKKKRRKEEEGGMLHSDKYGPGAGAIQK